MPHTRHEHAVLPPDHRDPLARLADLLLQHTAHRRSALVSPDGARVDLPDEVHDVLLDVVSALAQGLAVTVAPHDAMLTTQEAAALLGISRPTLVRLLDRAEIPSTRPGRHRRVGRGARRAGTGADSARHHGEGREPTNHRDAGRIPRGSGRWLRVKGHLDDQPTSQDPGPPMILCLWCDSRPAYEGDELFGCLTTNAARQLSSS